MSTSLPPCSDTRQAGAPVAQFTDLPGKYQIISKKSLDLDQYDFYCLGKSEGVKELHGALISQLALCHSIVVLVEGHPTNEITDREPLLKSLDIPSCMEGKIHFYGWTAKWKKHPLLKAIRQDLRLNILFKKEIGVSELRMERANWRAMDFLQCVHTNILQEVENTERDIKKNILKIFSEFAKSLTTKLCEMQSQHPLSKVVFLGSPAYFHHLELAPFNAVALVPKIERVL